MSWGILEHVELTYPIFLFVCLSGSSTNLDIKHTFENLQNQTFQAKLYKPLKITVLIVLYKMIRRRRKRKKEKKNRIEKASGKKASLAN